VPAGQPQKAIEYAETALRLSPHDPLAYVFLREKGLALFSLTRYTEAEDAFRASTAINPDLAINLLMLAASVALQGQDADARDTLQAISPLPVPSAKSIAQLRDRQPYDNPFLHEVCNRVYEGLRKAGMPED
jgi:adenylate cyclase